MTHVEFSKLSGILSAALSQHHLLEFENAQLELLSPPLVMLPKANLTSQSRMSGSKCCFLTCIQTSQEAGKVVWYSHHLKNFPQFVGIHTVKSCVVSEPK